MKKILKSCTETMNLNYQLRHEMINLNNPMDHIM